LILKRAIQVDDDNFPGLANEPIEAEFREKPRPAAPPPKPEPERPQPVAATAAPSDAEPDADFPAFQDVIGTGPLPVKVVFWQLGRAPGCMLGVAVLLLVIACPVLIVATGRESTILELLSFCVAFIAILGIVGALIVWARRKLAR
jgi:hypothetical protein